MIIQNSVRTILTQSKDRYGIKHSRFGSMNAGNEDVKSSIDIGARMLCHIAIGKACKGNYDLVNVYICHYEIRNHKFDLRVQLFWSKVEYCDLMIWGKVLKPCINQC